MTFPAQTAAEPLALWNLVTAMAWSRGMVGSFGCEAGPRLSLSKERHFARDGLCFDAADAARHLQLLAFNRRDPGLCRRGKAHGEAMRRFAATRRSADFQARMVRCASVSVRFCLCLLL